MRRSRHPGSSTAQAEPPALPELLLSDTLHVVAARLQTPRYYELVNVQGVEFKMCSLRDSEGYDLLAEGGVCPGCGRDRGTFIGPISLRCDRDMTVREALSKLDVLTCSLCEKTESIPSRTQRVETILKRVWLLVSVFEASMMLADVDTNPEELLCTGDEPVDLDDRLAWYDEMCGKYGAQVKGLYLTLNVTLPMSYHIGDQLQIALSPDWLPPRPQTVAENRWWKDLFHELCMRGLISDEALILDGGQYLLPRPPVFWLKTESRSQQVDFDIMRKELAGLRAHRQKMNEYAASLLPPPASDTAPEPGE